MKWVDWFLVGWFLFTILIMIGSVGKPREPIKPEVAVMGAVAAFGIVVWILWSHGVMA